MSVDPDDFDSDDDFDAPHTPPPIAPQQKLPSLRGLGGSSIDDEFDEEDFDDDFDDDFEEELEDDYPFEAELGGEAPDAGDADIDLSGDLDDEDGPAEPAVDDEEVEEAGD
jgi:hypothetical protein